MQSKALARLLAALLLLLVCALVQAQDDNLLTNPGFEQGFSEEGVASGWTAWTVPRDEDAPSFQNNPPGYFAASQSSEQGVLPHIRTGDDAQVYFSFFETHDAGVYQQVSGVTPGTELRFSIYSYTFSNGGDDLAISEDPAGVAVRVGIDPTGGTDPLADSVVYSEAAIFYDAFRQYSIIDVAESDTVTVFVRSTVSEPKQYTYIYLDDAVLEPTTNAQPDGEETEEVATEEMTEEATEEIAATETSTATDEPAESPTSTNTPTEEATETEEPTEEMTEVVVIPTETPTETVTPTETLVPTETTEPTETSVPTETLTPTEEPTATLEPSPTQDTGTVDETQEVDETEVAVETEDATELLLEDFPGRVTYTVQPGDTVYHLAQRYDSSMAAIIAANELPPSGLILRGQQLVIPVRQAAVTATPTLTPTVSAPGSGGGQAPADGRIYYVRPGDTLSSIAARFNTTVGTLIQLNGITNPNRILVGQPIRLPAAPKPVDVQPITYIVQPGDSLYLIAVRFGVTIQDLAKANNIQNVSRIYRGQRLNIPQ